MLKITPNSFSLGPGGSQKIVVEADIPKDARADS